MSDYCCPELYKELSLRLSLALEDAGITKEIVNARRNSYLLQETSHSIASKLRDDFTRWFHFGSQSEGTTTPGLNSDVDILLIYTALNVMKDWKAWLPRRQNFMILKDKDLPPQQYFLQVISDESPEPDTDIIYEQSVRVKHDVILFSSDAWKKSVEYMSYIVMGNTHSAGPSSSWTDQIDVVHAMVVTDLMPEVEQWVERHRPGHWPTKELFEKAKTCMCFLVPAGHPLSDTKHLEWRLSPNLIERNLMFSLNLTQLKCYVLLKMVKKSILNSVVEDGITSFHCKTLLFYTIERTHLHLWQESNLGFLLRQCLQTLRKWLKLRICPHYIIGGVNLFDGKLTPIQCRKLHTAVLTLIKDNLRGLSSIDIDNIGNKAFSNSFSRNRFTDVRMRYKLHSTIRSKIYFDQIDKIQNDVYLILTNINEHGNAVAIRVVQDYLRQCQLLCSRGDSIEKQTASTVFRRMLPFLASMYASSCIQNQKIVNERLLDCFVCSPSTDIASCQLKLASILLTSGYFHSAAVILCHVDKQFNKQPIKSISACGKCFPRDTLLDTFAAYSNNHESLNESSIALSVYFLRQEAYCVPPALLYEMNRTGIAPEISERALVREDWKRYAAVDARVFLHYLQFLTYGGLGDKSRQKAAVDALLADIDDHFEDLNHVEVAFNLVGHCFEMRGNMTIAEDLYRTSLTLKPLNNAANWHIQRIEGKLYNVYMS